MFVAKWPILELMTGWILTLTNLDKNKSKPIKAIANGRRTIFVGPSALATRYFCFSLSQRFTSESVV